MTDHDREVPAKEEAVLEEIIRLLFEELISGETTARRQLICEKASYATRVIEEEHIHRIIETVLRPALYDRQRLYNSFEIRRRDVQAAQVGKPLSPPAGAEREGAPHARLRRRRKRKPPPTGGSA